MGLDRHRATSVIEQRRIRGVSSPDRSLCRRGEPVRCVGAGVSESVGLGEGESAGVSVSGSVNENESVGGVSVWVRVRMRA